MIRKILPLALSLALAVSPAAEVFASSEPVNIPVEESVSDVALTDESVSELMDASYAEDKVESQAETAAEENPEDAAEVTAEPSEEFTAEGLIFRKNEENELFVTGVLEETGEIIIPEEISFGEEVLPVAGVEKDALSGEAVEKISIPASVREFGSQSLPSLVSVEVSEENEVLEIVDGVLFAKDEEGGSELVLYPSGLEEENYVIPEGTTAVAENAFCGNTGLAVIVIGEDVKSIEAGAFSGLREKVRIAFVRDNAAIELEEGAFSFKQGDDSVIYFENEDILNEILESSPDFAVAVKEEETAEEETAEEEPAEEETAEEEAVEEEPAEEEAVEEEPAAEEPVVDETSEEESALKETEEEVPAFTFNAEGIPEDILELLDVIETNDGPEQVGAGEDAAIARGYYQITNVYRTYRMVHASGGIIIGSYVSGSRATIFEVVPVGGGKYAMINFESGNAVTLESTPPADYVRAVEASYNGDDSQKWYIRNLDESGAVEIIPVLDETMRLELKDGVSPAGTELVVRTGNGELYQAWQFTEKENVAVSLETGTYTISTYKNKDIVVEVQDGATSTKANVQLAADEGCTYQQFTITALGYGNYYKIENVRSGMVWDAAGGGRKSGTNIQQYYWNGTGAQVFRVIETEESGEKVYQFIGKSSGLAVDYAGGKAEAGVNVRLYTSNNTGGQKWYLTKKDLTTVPGTDANISSGFYKIYPSLSSSVSVGVKSALSTDGLSAVMCSADQMDGTIFKIEPTSEGRYKITDVSTGKLLTYEGNYAEPNTDIVHRSQKGSLNQEWYIRKKSASDTSYILVPASNLQTAMDLTDAQTAEGTNVRLAQNSGSKAQTWNLKEVSDPNTHVLANGIYSIASLKKNTMVLAVAGGSEASGANINISSKTGTAPNELFKVEAVGSTGNEYKITNVWSGRSLDVAGGSTAAGANLQQYTWNNSTAQRFRIIQVMGGSSPYYKIIGVGGGKAVDIASGKTSEGTNVRMYYYNGTAAQLWKFNKVTSINTVVTGTPVNFVCKANTGYKAGWKVNTTSIKAQKDSKSVTQAFRIETVSSGVYRIYNLGSGNYLTATGKTGVVFADWEGKDTQKWKFQSTGDGDYSFSICNVSNGKYLAHLSNVSDDTGMWVGEGNTSKNRKYILQPAVINSGWVEVETDKWRYYKDDGSFLRDQFYEDGKYYFNSQGYVSSGWAKYGAFYYYYKGKDGRENYDSRPYLSALFGTKTSWTGYTCPNCQYHLSIDTIYPCQATVYTTFPGTSGWNLPVFSFYVSPGTSNQYGQSSTIYGDRRVGGKSRWQELMGPSYGQYATVIETYTYIAGSTYIGWTNTGQYIHSVACGEPNDHNLDPNVYNLLGTRQSHGCVRVPVRYAYWVYTFMDTYQGIGVGENLARPLSTLPLPRAYSNIDPTDPAYTGNYGYLDTQNYVNWNGYIVR